MASDDIVETIRILVENGASPDTAPCPGGRSPIAWVMKSLVSARYGQQIYQLQMATEIFAERGFGMLVQPSTEEGLAPIHAAAVAGDLEGVRRELESGVPAEWKSFGDPEKNALQIAVERGDGDMVALLREYGAGVSAVSARPAETQGEGRY
jgi:hypothetical protein